MSKRIDDIWSEVPGLPKALLLGGLLFYLISFGMEIIYTGVPTGWWSDLTNLFRQPGMFMISAGTLICAAALIGGGIAAGKDK